jgi:uroporphyrinogen-III synthase
VKVACRGPKPSAPLRRHGVPISVAAREPYTTPELLEAMAGLELAGTRAAVLHYGERNTELSAALADRGARVDDLCVYEWLLPEDTTELRGLVQVILEGGVDAVAFTSQIQARHLFAVAGEVGLAEELTDALNTGVVTASVAPTCLAVLEGLGVRPHVVPRHAKMGHLVVALAEHIERGGSRGSIPTAEDAPP